MKHVFTVNEVCQSCRGTGLYVSMAERDGAAVVCRACSGTGCYKHTHEYEEFEKRANPPNEVKRVYLVNPGICIGEKPGVCTLDDFGGMPVKDWKEGKPFPKGSEDRKHTCPAWWYQSADYDRKPKWRECEILGSFSDCRQFPCKDRCWKKFDTKETP